LKALLEGWGNHTLKSGLGDDTTCLYWKNRDLSDLYCIILYAMPSLMLCQVVELIGGLY
jgi:hypothetical protein